eukprot:1352853-Amorphochlora_amoeboformis.AAC.1
MKVEAPVLPAGLASSGLMLKAGLTPSGLMLKPEGNSEGGIASISFQMCLVEGFVLTREGARLRTV